MISTITLPWLAGYIPDLPTPFDEAGRIDINAFARLCERQIAAGVSAIVVCETAGEALTLSPTEQEFVIRAAVDIARGRTRVIAGACSNSTEQAIQLTRRAEAAGADAILSVVPYYNKPMQVGIHAHFQAVSLSTGLPVILHDRPSRTMRNIADETLARLCQSSPFAGLLDGTGDVTRPIRLSVLVPPGFRLLSGDDATAIAYVAAGGDGCISTISNVTPDVCRAIFSSLRQGRLSSARDLQRRLQTLEACLAGQNPAALKYALSLLGLIDPVPRLPLVELDESAKAEVARALSGLAEDDLAVTAEA
jgi:4-hydroxy-tetrahydrodipicolinate synthase